MDKIDIKPSPGGPVQNIRRSLQYLRPHWRLVIYSGLLVLVGSAVGLLGPWPMSLLIDTVLTEHGLEKSRLPQILSHVIGSWAYDTRALIVLTMIASLLITAANHGLAVLDDYVHTRL